VGRSPINRVLKQIANFVTLGVFNKKQQELGYDDVYHLYLLVKVRHENRDVILRLHKEAIVKFHELTDIEFKNLRHTEHRGFAIEFSGVTLGEFIQTILDKNPHNEIFVYDVVTANCQVFILKVLRSNNIVLPPEKKALILQSVHELLANSPTLANLFRKITDLGATVETISGGGLELHES